MTNDEAFKAINALMLRQRAIEAEQRAIEDALLNFQDSHEDAYERAVLKEAERTSCELAAFSAKLAARTE